MAVQLSGFLEPLLGREQCGERGRDPSLERRAILRAVALIPVLGLLVWLGATIFGLGVLGLALWRARTPAAPPSAPPPAATTAPA